MAHRTHPHVSIPPGAAPPVIPSPRSSWSSGSHLFQSPEPPDSPNIWADHHSTTTFSPLAPDISFDVPSRPPSRATSFYQPESATLAFPEPQLHRSSSNRSTLRPSVPSTHRSTKSELAVGSSVFHGESRPPSFVSTASSPDVCSDTLSVFYTSEHHIFGPVVCSRPVGRTLQPDVCPSLDLVAEQRLMRILQARV